MLVYYTISPGAIEFAKVLAPVTKRLGRYEVSVFRPERLAVSLAVKRGGSRGERLLATGKRALSGAVEVGGVPLATDAKSEPTAE